MVTPYDACHRDLDCFQAELSIMMSDCHESTFIRFDSLLYIRISLGLVFNSFWLFRKIQMDVYIDANGDAGPETRTDRNHRKFRIPITKTKKQTTDPTTHQMQ